MTVTGDPPTARTVTLRGLAAVVLPASGLLLAVGAWWLMALHDPITVPTPDAVLQNLRGNFFTSPYLEAHGLNAGKGYWYDLLYTVQNVLLGVALGTCLGVGIGLISIPFPAVSDVLNPLFATFGAAPIFVAAPFFLIWFGIVSSAQVIMVAFYTTVLMYIFSRRAAENVSREYLEAASSFGANGRQVFWRVYLPATIPELIGGFRIALAGAWGLEAIAELLGAQRGIGFLINYYSEVYGLVGMLTLTFLLGCAAIVCDAIAMFGARSLVRWTATGKVA